jgi:hypothetical protein
MGPRNAVVDDKGAAVTLTAGLDVDKKQANRTTPRVNAARAQTGR